MVKKSTVFENEQFFLYVFEIKLRVVQLFIMCNVSSSFCTADPALVPNSAQLLVNTHSLNK